MAPADGMDSKETILKVALNFFAQKGYEGSSIRGIAREASVNLVMINYYFGSKEKCYRKQLNIKRQP